MKGLLTHNEGSVWIVSDGIGGHVFEIVASEKDAQTIYRYHHQLVDVTVKKFRLVTHAELQR